MILFKIKVWAFSRRPTLLLINPIDISIRIDRIIVISSAIQLPAYQIVLR